MLLLTSGRWQAVSHCSLPLSWASMLDCTAAGALCCTSAGPWERFVPLSHGFPLRGVEPVRRAC